jgi:hypothetical protein
MRTGSKYNNEVAVIGACGESEKEERDEKAEEKRAL